MENLELEKEKQFASGRFGIPAEDVLWYNSGSCYSRIGVRTLESAEAVSKAVEGQTANGGFLHGMPLGSYSEIENGYEVYC